jgi:hypothetical protein
MILRPSIFVLWALRRKRKANNFKKYTYFCGMKMFRKPFMRAIFLLIAGLAFLNLNFLMAEVSALRSAYSKTTMENIVKMFRASANEEETETEAPGHAKEIDIVDGHLYHLQLENTYIASALKLYGIHARPHPGYLQIESPPPDLFLI